MLSVSKTDAINFAGAKSISLNYYLLGLSLFFLPFTQALTINIFFPLKIYEILIFLLFLLNPKIFLSIPRNKIVFCLIVFVFFVFISFVINIFKSYNYPLDLSDVRVSRDIDSLLKFLYLLLALSFFLLCYKYFVRNGFSLLKFFFAGATFSCIYSWYLFTSGLLHFPYLKLPGMDTYPQTIITDFGVFVRCSTFKEGNFMGLYLLIAGGLALQFKKLKLSLFYFITTFTTFSTSAILCAFIFLLIVTIRKNINKPSRLIVSSATIIAFIVILNSSSENFRTIIFNKLFANEDAVSNSNEVFSRLDRLNAIWVGYNEFRDNPLFGVGTANYGLHFTHYNDFNIDIAGFKRIPNNVYVEQLSESGLFVCICFLVYLFFLIKDSRSLRYVYLNTTLLVAIIYFASYPSYSILFLWLFFAILISYRKRVEEYEMEKLKLSQL